MLVEGYTRRAQMQKGAAARQHIGQWEWYLPLAYECVPTINNRLPYLQTPGRNWVCPLGEISPAKNNNAKKNKTPKSGAKKTAFSNARNYQNTNPKQTVIKGQCQISSVKGDSNESFYLDYLGFKTCCKVPRLSANCEMYERWFVRHMALEYVPTVPVTTAGMIHISPEYDPLDAIQYDAVSMSKNEMYKSAPVTQPLVVNMPNFKQPDGAYIRPDMYTSPTNSDRSVEYGYFNVVADGVGASTIVGYLVLHYDVVFTRPQVMDSGLSFSSVPDRIFRDGSGPTFSRGSETVGATTVGAIFAEKAGVAESIDTCDTITAIIDTIESGITLANAVNGSVAAGSRIFMRGATNKITAASTNTTTSTSPNIGLMATSRTFDPSTILRMSTSGVNGFSLRDVRSIGGWGR